MGCEQHFKSTRNIHGYAVDSYFILQFIISHFLVHTLAEQNILIVHSSCIISVFLPSLCWEGKYILPILNEQEKKQAHYVGMAGKESTVFGAWISRGAPLGKKGWGERRRGREEEMSAGITITVTVQSWRETPSSCLLTLKGEHLGNSVYNKITILWVLSVWLYDLCVNF